MSEDFWMVHTEFLMPFIEGRYLTAWILIICAAFAVVQIQSTWKSCRIKKIVAVVCSVKQTDYGHGQSRHARMDIHMMRKIRGYALVRGEERNIIPVSAENAIAVEYV